MHSIIAKDTENWYYICQRSILDVLKIVQTGTMAVKMELGVKCHFCENSEVRYVSSNLSVIYPHSICLALYDSPLLLSEDFINR